MRNKKNYIALLFMLPSFFGFTLFYLYHFALSFGYSLIDKPINGIFVGLSNFIDLLNNKSYLIALKNTIIFICISVPLNIVLSLALALIIKDTKGYKKMFTLIFLIPLVIPSGSMIFFWKSLFDDNGYLNYLLSLNNIKSVDWLNSNLVRYVIIFIYIWKNLGYNIVLFLAGISSIPKEYYEYSKVEGANIFQEFFKISLVYLTPTTILTIIMSIINSFKVFREIYLLTGSYPHESIYMLQHFMNNMFSSLNYQKLSASTWILVLVIIIITQMLFKIERSVQNEK